MTRTLKTLAIVLVAAALLAVAAHVMSGAIESHLAGFTGALAASSGLG